MPYLAGAALDDESPHAAGYSISFLEQGSFTLHTGRANWNLLPGMAMVTRTCFATGFNNLSYFIRAFRRAFGASPSRLKNQPETVARRP